MPGLGETSSHAEIVAWLDRESFGAARVGISSRTVDAYQRADGTEEPRIPGERFVFSQGFRLARLDGCTLVLRNDDVKLLDYGDDSLLTIGGGGRHTLDYLRRAGARYVAELYVPLQAFGAKKGRGAYRHTNNAKNAARLGAWRTTFKAKRFRRAGVSVYPAGRREEIETVGGETLTFTFDTREAAARFDAAFRRAIQLCAEGQAAAATKPSGAR